MHRRDFLTLGGIGLGGLLVPSYFGKAIAAEQLVTTLDIGVKKNLADAALGAATGAGATYCDVRVGRYLRQSVITRETRVENVVNPNRPASASASSPMAPGALPPPMK